MVVRLMTWMRARYLIAVDACYPTYAVAADADDLKGGKSVIYGRHGDKEVRVM